MRSHTTQTAVYAGPEQGCLRMGGGDRFVRSSGDRFQGLPSEESVEKFFVQGRDGDCFPVGAVFEQIGIDDDIRIVGCHRRQIFLFADRFLFEEGSVRA